MICPRCETATLLELDRQGITLDRCERCRGIWLDRGELEKLIAHAAGGPAHPAQAPAMAQPPPGSVNRYRRADSDHDDDDDRRSYGKRKSWWEIFD